MAASSAATLAQLAEANAERGRLRAAEDARIAEHEARLAEHAKDKSFMLTVVNTLKEQLAEERGERAKLTASVEQSARAQQAGFAELKAAHEASGATRAAEAQAEAAALGRRACRELHAKLASFCDKWVPSGAEVDRVVVLEQLRELEEKYFGA